MNQVLAQLGSRTRWRAPARCRRPLDVVQVRVAGQFNSVEELKRHADPRSPPGGQLRLGDIADIRRGYVDPPRSRCATRARR
jgi:multidrug efflux pump